MLMYHLIFMVPPVVDTNIIPLLQIKPKQRRQHRPSGLSEPKEKSFGFSEIEGYTDIVNSENA